MKFWPLILILKCCGLTGCAAPPPSHHEATAQCESLVEVWLERLAVCDPAVVDPTRELAVPRCATNETVYSPLAFDLCDRGLREVPCTGEPSLASTSSRCLDFMMSWVP